MDAYPTHYVAHNVPLVALCGLGTPDPNAFDEIERQHAILQEGGKQIVSEAPDVTGSRAEDLLNCFQEFDARDAAWNNRPGRGKMGSMGFTYRTVGRSITFPRQKADWPRASEDAEPANGPRRSSLILHSPLSPLTPGSTTYPDGIITPLWFTKHQLLLPAALLVFFRFSSDSSRIILEDNKLKTEINALKLNLTNSNFKTRLGIVLVAESDDVDAGAAERVANLRRATGLDSKSLFHLPGYATMVELRAFVGTVLAALQPACIEYYRDLSKHTRRKRSRGTTPAPITAPTAGNSQTLSSNGWNVRYETKLGFFAEFRQEMDAAGRSYEAAYETLLDSDIFEAISRESSRFNEYRMLADVLAIRIIRCLLWTGQTTSAVQSWSNHKSRIRDLVDRKGGGSNNYTWQTWEAVWSSVMGELIERVDLPVFHAPQELRSPGSSLPEIPTVIAPPERSFGNDPRLAPWDFLHHSGYWHSLAAQHLRNRRQLAMAIPDEDRKPRENPSAASSRSHDQRDNHFLSLEPHEEASFDHSMLLVNTLTRAAEQYSSHEGLRCTERSYLEVAEEHIKACRWSDAMEVLHPLWQTLSWRPSGWWDLVFQVSRAMRRCAAELEDWETLLATEWELLSNCLPHSEDIVYDFHHSLDAYKPQPKPYAQLDYDNLAPTFTASFTFSKSKGNAGIPEPAQLAIAFCAHGDASPVTLASVEVAFEGGLKEVVLMHDGKVTANVSRSGGLQYFDIDPNATPTTGDTSGAASSSHSSRAVDLSFKSGACKLFYFKLLPREAGEVRASSALLKIREEAFDFDMRIPLQDYGPSPPWWTCKADVLHQQKLNLGRYCSLMVLPKPPKLRVSLTYLPESFYVDETAELPIDLLNEEADVADIKISVSLSGSKENTPALFLDEIPTDDDLSMRSESANNLKDITIGKLAPQSQARRVVQFRAASGVAELSLVIRADYFLVSDPETPITVQLKEKIHIAVPFDAAYEFVPQIQKDPWPSYFVVDDSGTNSPNGISQSWNILTRITSSAAEPLRIQNMLLKVADSKFVAKSSTEAVDEHREGVEVHPSQRLERTFRLDSQKGDLEDRRTASVYLQLDLIWSRVGEHSKPTTTTLLLPSLSLPFGEPRVLCTAQNVSGSPHMVNLLYALENPSTHLLTFSVTMETSDEFAFGGPKATMLQLVPFSRVEIKYTLIPFQRGTWIHPYLRVNDTGFGQELKIHASAGCRNEKKAIAIWVDGKT